MTLRGNPFVGLRPFEAEDALYYFGRREQSQALLNLLRETRLLAVVGSSGAGKSSLVRAGLIPNLEAGFLARSRDTWHIARMKPGDRPVFNLAQALFEAMNTRDTSTGSNDWYEAIRTKGVHGAKERIGPVLEREKSNLFLLVDQFEEVFRFGVRSKDTQKQEQAAEFVDLLLRLTDQDEVPVYVCLTMRTDYIGDCDVFHGLPEAMNRSQYLVPRLTRAQRREVIEGPIRLSDASISTRLLDRLMNESGQFRDDLPVLQHALMRTWEKWNSDSSPGSSIDMDHYKDIGTMRYALSKHADEALAELSEGDQLLAKRLFQALTETDAENRSIRRPAHLSELEAVTGASGDQLILIIDKFRKHNRAFLVLSPDDDPLVDISHESLMRQWRTLKKWIKEEAKSAESYRDLARRARGKASLLGGFELIRALKWREKYKPNAAWAKRYHPSFDRAMEFLDASKEQEERETQKKEKQRELEIKRREEQIKRKRTRIFLTIISIIGGIAIALAFWAVRSERNAAKEEAKRAKNEKEMVEILKEKEEKKGKEITRLNEDLKKERDNAIKAENIATNKANEAENQKKEAVRQRNRADENAEKAEKNELKKTIQKYISDINEYDAIFGQYLAKAKELAVRSIAETKNEELKALLALAAYDLNNKAYYNLENDTREKFNKYKNKKADNNMDNIQEAKDLGDRYKTLQEKAKNKRQPPEIFEALRKAYNANVESKDILHSAESRALAVTHDNKIVFNNRKGEIKVSSLSSGSNDLRLPVLEKIEDLSLPKKTEGWVSSFAEIKDRHRLYCGTRGGSIVYWEGNNWEKSELVLDKLPGPILSMVYSENKKWLIYSVKNTIYRYDVNEKASNTVVKKDNPLRAITLVEGKENSFLIYADSNIYCQPLRGDLKEKGGPIGNFKSNIHAIAYDRSKKLLVLGNEMGKIHIARIDCENLESGKKPEFDPLAENHTGIVRALAFSPDDRYLASNSMDGTIILWKLEENNKDNNKDKIPHLEHVLTIESELKILSVVFDPNEKYIIFSDEQNLRICLTRPEVLYEILCRKKEGELTPEEWKRYIGDEIKQGDLVICPSKKENKSEK